MSENKVNNEMPDDVANKTSFQLPHELNLTGNVFLNYCEFEENFRLYMKATGFMNLKDEDRKINLLLKFIGNNTEKIIKDNKLYGVSLEEVLKNLKAYFEKNKSTIMYRYKMFLSVQEENETIDQYVTRLKILAEPCKFGTEEDNQIRDRLVFGLRNKNWRDKLLNEIEFSLNEVVRWCSTWEMDEMEEVKIKETGSKDEQEGIKELRNENVLKSETKKYEKSKTVRNEVRFSLSKKKFICAKCGHLHGLNECPAFGEVCHVCKKPNHFANQCKFKKLYLTKNKFNCIKCGQLHGIKECPAFGKPCYNCNKLNHFARECRLVKTVKEVQIKNEHEYLNGNEPNNEVTKDMTQNNWNVNLKIEENDFCNFKLDTGSDVNLIPYSLYKKLKCFDNAKIKKSQLKLLSFTKNEIKVEGYVDLHCTTGSNDNYQVIRFYLLTQAGSCVLGLQTCIDLNLIRRV